MTECIDGLISSSHGGLEVRTESSDLLAVLDELNLDTLANGGVGLLSLNTDLLEDDTLGVGSTTEGGGLVGGTEEALLEVEVGPLLLLTVRLELASGVKTTRLSLTHNGGLYRTSVQSVSIWFDFRAVSVCLC